MCMYHIAHIRCCSHISELEHTYFSVGNNQDTITMPRLQQQQDNIRNRPATDDLIGNDLNMPYVYLLCSLFSPSLSICLSLSLCLSNYPYIYLSLCFFLSI